MMDAIFFKTQFDKTGSKDVFFISSVKLKNKFNFEGSKSSSILPSFKFLLLRTRTEI